MQDITSSQPTIDRASTRDFQDATYRKIAWRLMPILFLGFVVSYLDRSNIGFAKLQMQSDLSLSDSVYGLGAGIFFIGYFLFEIPSNLMLHRVGARRWIARIMVSWGIVSALMCFVRGPLSFYALRFLLGVAEAGLVPGVILYLTYWFPATRRARMIAVFYAAVAASGIVGGPLAGWLMKGLGGANGLAGWQWLFILEGIPSLVMAVVVLRYLDDSPAHARWLTTTERDYTLSQLDAPETPDDRPLLVFADPRMWVLTFIYFVLCAGIVGVGLWLPTLVQATGVHDLLQIGVLSAVPYVIAIVAMIFLGRHSDRTGERRWHIAVPLLLAALGLALSVRFEHDTSLALIGLTLAAGGILCATPPFWTLPVGLLHGRSAAVGIAMINATGNLGSFVSPFFIGYTRDLTHSTATGLYAIVAALLLGTLVVAFTHSIPARTR